MKDARILITGATSQVGLPVARALAKSNTVFGLGRLRRAIRALRVVDERDRWDRLGG